MSRNKRGVPKPEESDTSEKPAKLGAAGSPAPPQERANAEAERGAPRRKRRRRQPTSRGGAEQASPSLTKFRSLYFGMAAAENEVADDPERFVRTYYDPWGLIDEISRARRFLILGPKGAGKSATARYLELRWKKELGDHAVFSSFVDFDELNRTSTPITSLDKRLVGDVPALVDAAWRLFLGMRMLESLVADPGCDLSNDPKVAQFLSSLRDAGLASSDYPQVLRRVRERRGTFRIPAGLFSGGKTSTETDNVSTVVVGEALLRLVERSQTPNRHLLVIDGLDKAIGDNPAYWETLASLVRVTDSLERSLRAAGQSHVMLMLLCRSDVFRRVRFADAGKIAADAGFHLAWGAERADPSSVLLWDYLAAKAEISKDELLKFLPRFILVGDRGGRAQPINTDFYLLQFTRYTPRDMTLLFRSIQQATAGHARLGADEVRAGADAFARQNFFNEMISEAHGLLPPDLVDQFDNIISALPYRVIKAGDLKAAIADAGVGDLITPEDLGEYLFLQGAIGNYLDEPDYVQFYHRRDTYKFQRRGPWVLHNALVYAYNIPWARPRDTSGRRKR